MYEIEKNVLQPKGNAACKPSDCGLSHERLHAAIWQCVSRVLIILLSFGAGFVNATAQSRTSAYVTNLSGTVSVIDTTTNTVVATIPVGIFPSGVAITPDGTRAYVVNQFLTNQGNNTVSVIDTMTNTIVATISVGLGPSQIAITPDGTRAYVPDQQDLIISVIDTATNTVVTTIPVSGAAGIAITPDGTQAYVTSPGEGAVSVINTATNTVVATIRLGTNQNPFGVAITPDGTRAYVTINFPNVVSVIDTATNTVVATIPVGVGPVAVAITPVAQTPTSKEQCKHSGYLKFGPPAGPFKNQGQCVSYVEHH